MKTESLIFKVLPLALLLIASTTYAQERTACLCAQWSPNTVTFVNGSTGLSQTLSCGSTVTVTDLSIYSFTPNFACSSPGPGCALTYTWSITGPGTPSSGTTAPFGYTFTNPGLYTVIIQPSCGGSSTYCPPCTIKVAYKPCKCGGWDPIPVTIAGGPKAPLNPNVKCNTSKVIKPGTYILSGHYKCAPPSCACTYAWTWTGPGATSGNGSGVNFTHLFALGMYHVTVVPICGGINKCPACDFYFSVQP